MIYYSVVIPVYNSFDTLQELVQRIHQTLSRYKTDYEVILIDDNSKDDSWTKIKHICRELKFTSGIRLSKNYGQWIATLAGIERSKGKYIVTIDDDLQYAPEDIAILIDKISSSNYHLVFGIPKDKYTTKYLGNYFYHFRNRVVNSLLGKPLTDSFKIFTRNIILTPKEELSMTLHFEAHITGILDEAHIGYVTVNYHERKSGTSNYKLFSKAAILMEHLGDYLISSNTFRKNVSFLLGIFLLLNCMAAVFINCTIVHQIAIILTSLSCICVILTYTRYLERKHYYKYWILERI